MPNLPSEYSCTGCGACKNICSKGAITMKTSDRWQTVPVVDESSCVNCGKCESVCTALNYKSKNLAAPRFFAAYADDDTRKDSTSGAMFVVLARYIFKKDGVVCGAAYDENFKVRHIFAENEEELMPIRSSKYLQSDTGDSFKKTKEYLDAGRYVLYSGTPCQIAGLNSFLGKDYDKLLTADILCYGAPSQALFDKYLKEISDGKEVASCDFRSKRFNWSHSHILITYKDGTEYVETKEKDPYYRAFRRKLTYRDSCYDCQYAETPRPGDFTLGDLWGWEKFDKDSSDGKGTSFVFTNNKKAEAVLDEVKCDLKYLNELKVPNNDYKYGFDQKTHRELTPDPGRERFLELVKYKTFTDASKMALDNKYDICLPSCLNSRRLGTVMTYYALYRFLTDQGYSVKTLEGTYDSPYKKVPEARTFTDRWVPSYDGPYRYKSIYDMHSINEECDTFLVGSDQVLLDSFAASRNNYFFLHFAEGSKKKIAYATSFGGPNARGSKEYYDELKFHLNDFEYLSFREDDGVNFANETLKLDKKARIVVDPVFLCDKSHYEDIIAEQKVVRNGKKFITSYFIIPRDRTRAFIENSKAHFDGIEFECISPDGIPEMPIGNTLERIKNCEFLITDSFHGMCFAIIFKKDFLVLPRDFKDRFVSILSRLGLEDRIIEDDLSNLNEKSYSHIEYDEVYKKLDALIEDSKEFLLNALASEDDELMTREYDMAMRALSEYAVSRDKEIEKLKNELDKTNRTFILRLNRFISRKIKGLKNKI